MKVTINGIKMFIARAILLFVLADSLFLLFTHLVEFIPSSLETIALGIPTWIVFGAISPYVVYALFYVLGYFKRNFYLLRVPNKEESIRVDTFFFRSLDMTITPTLFIFGVLNFVLNYFNFVLSFGIYLFMFLLVVVLGFLIPLINIIKDSELVIISPENRTIQPVGTPLKVYLRGISGITAFFGLAFTLLMSNVDIYSTFIVLMAVLTVTYPPIFVICLAYNTVHNLFVGKFNSLLSKRFRKCKVTVEIGSVSENVMIIRTV